MDEDKSRVALAQLVRDMRENIAAHIEANQLQARITRAKPGAHQRGIHRASGA